MKKIITLLFLFALLASPIFSQVHINEYSASNLNNIFDNYGKTEDWIELHNNSDVAVDISGYHLSDKESKPAKWEIPTGTMIPANGFLVFWCSGRDESGYDNFHTNFKLAQTKSSEIVLLSDADENIIEMFSLNLTLTEHSHCRVEDGSDEWKICTAPTPKASNNGSTQFARYTATPSANQAAGFYTNNVTVALINNEDNATLRYTLDGSNPTNTSTEYTVPINITSTRVIKAQAFSNDASILPGKMDFNTYFINENNFTLPVFSVAADEVINLANGNGELIPIGSLEYFVDNEREATSYGSLNRHGQDSWILPHRSIDWVSRDEMGYSKAVEAQLFSYSERDEYQKFMFRNSGDDNYPANNDNAHEGSTHIRDEYVHTLAMEGGLKLDQRAQERVILFLNGEYWGLYGMRERPVDHDYTKEYYDQGKYDLQYLTTWNTTEAQYGGIDAFNEWYTLRNFILNNDMSDQANYDLVKDEFNTLSLIDYMTVNLNCVASDWLNYNTGWWRGLDPDGDHKKWGYILWDLDATFDYYINYSGVPNISPDARPCDIEDIGNYMDQFFGTGGNDSIPSPDQCTTILNGSSPYPATDPIFAQVINADSYCCETDWDNECQGIYDNFVNNPNAAGEVTQSGNVGKHEKIFLKLQEESPEFRQLYYSRQADLQNTVYSCENMMETLERMLGEIEPEMPRQIERWGGSMAEWEENVQKLKDFIMARCELFDEGMVDCFEVTGPFDITLKVEPAGVGEIKLNTIDLEELPWTGAYYGGMENKIKAKATNDDYEFSHWETSAGSVITPNVTERKAFITLEGQDVLTAVFTDMTTAVDDVETGVSLNVYPNPASSQIIIKYVLEEAMAVDIQLYSLVGQKMNMATEGNKVQTAGEHSFVINVAESNLPTGIYLLRLNANGNEVTKKVTIIE